MGSLLGGALLDLRFTARAGADSGAAFAVLAAGAVAASFYAFRASHAARLAS